MANVRTICEAMTCKTQSATIAARKGVKQLTNKERAVLQKQRADTRYKREVAESVRAGKMGAKRYSHRKRKSLANFAAVQRENAERHRAADPDFTPMIPSQHITFTRKRR